VIASLKRHMMDTYNKYQHPTSLLCGTHIALHLHNYNQTYC
jgi:hypothetical protein